MKNRWLWKSVLIAGMIVSISAADESGNRVEAAAPIKSSIEQVMAHVQSKVAFSSYLEATYTFQNASTQNQTLIKVWDNTLNGKLRREEQRNQEPMHVYKSQEGKALLYVRGQASASLYNSGVSVKDNQLNRTVEELKRLQLTTNSTRVDEEEVLNRTAYHLSGKGKTLERIINVGGKQEKLLQKQPDVELWIDSETGLLLKKISTLNGDTSIYTVNKVEFQSSFDQSLFVLNVPKGVTIIETK
ncbi:LolA family protein [Brevibacillus sp. H7]|uniref:LolA family protein n=1 Tax=Brevibacillus sp. H7 TaxID=3349138 RepID=UPI0037FE77E7